MQALTKLICKASSVAENIGINLQSLFLLITRIYIASVFLKSGVQKLSDWDSTLFLFEYEYHIPLLPFKLAAVMGTAAEIILPLLILFGALTRISAIALFLFNIVAVYSYKHVLLKGGISILTLKGFLPYGISFPRGFEDHFVWGLLILSLIAFGGGRFTIDRLIHKSQSVKLISNY